MGKSDLLQSFLLWIIKGLEPKSFFPLFPSPSVWKCVNSLEGVLVCVIEQKNAERPRLSSRHARERRRCLVSGNPRLSAPTAAVNVGQAWRIYSDWISILLFTGDDSRSSSARTRWGEILSKQSWNVDQTRRTPRFTGDNTAFISTIKRRRESVLSCSG